MKNATSVAFFVFWGLDDKKWAFAGVTWGVGAKGMFEP
jgi:hypothetical protein